MDDTRENSIQNRLLIVDDEPGITGLIEIAAKQVGYAVSYLHDSSHFEKAFETIKPTVVFLNVNMPNRGGLELIALLAKTNSLSKIVVSTRGLAIAGTLSKPFRKQQLLDLLVSLTERPN